MVTLVGTQTEFKKVIKELIELEYDAIEAYKLAIEKLKEVNYKNKLEEFLIDHKRHVAEIKQAYINKLDLPGSGDFIKGNLAKLKVVIANAIGSDKSILKAMLTNELDTNIAYERVNNHPQKPDDSKITLILQLAYEDEKRHKAWLTSETATFGDIG